MKKFQIFFILLITIFSISGCASTPWVGELSIGLPNSKVKEDFVSEGLVSPNKFVYGSFKDATSELIVEINLVEGKETNFYAGVQVKDGSTWNLISRIAKVKLESATKIHLITKELRSGSVNILRTVVWDATDSDEIPLATSENFHFRAWDKTSFLDAFTSLRNNYNSTLDDLITELRNQIAGIAEADDEKYGVGMTTKKSLKHQMEIVSWTNTDAKELYIRFNDNLISLGIPEEVSSEVFNYVSSYNKYQDLYELFSVRYCLNDKYTPEAYAKCLGDVGSANSRKLDKQYSVVKNARKALAIKFVSFGLPNFLENESE